MIQNSWNVTKIRSCFYRCLLTLGEGVLHLHPLIFPTTGPMSFPGYPSVSVPRGRGGELYPSPRFRLGQYRTGVPPPPPPSVRRTVLFKIKLNVVFENLKFILLLTFCFSAVSSSSGCGVSSPFLPGGHPYPQLPGSPNKLPGIACLSPRRRQQNSVTPLNLHSLSTSPNSTSSAATHSPILQHHKPLVRRTIPPPLSPVVGGTFLQLKFLV